MPYRGIRDRRSLLHNGCESYLFSLALRRSPKFYATKIYSCTYVSKSLGHADPSIENRMKPSAWSHWQREPNKRVISSFFKIQ